MVDATIIGRVAVKVIPDTDDFRREAKSKLSAIENSLKPIKIDFVADVTKAVNETRQAIKDASDHARRNPVNLHFGTNAASYRTVQARIAFLARTRTVTLTPHLNEAAVAKTAAALAALSGARSVGNIFENLGETLQDLDKAIPKIGAISLAISDLTSLLLTSTSNVLAFGSSLASIGGAALALPGILGGMALGLGASVAVLKDFNDVLPEVADKFSALQDSMSTKFWAKAEGPFRNFINTIFPQFQAGMEDTSVALGGFFANLADSATGKFDGALEVMFDDLAESIDVAGKYTDNFIGILRRLGKLGAGYLPDLAEWFGEQAEGFDDWLKTKGQKGLRAFVDEGVKALQDLGGVLSATGSLFAGLARAAEAGGGSTLAILRKTMEGAAKAVNDADFQRELSEVFEGAHKGMSEIANGSGKQFQSFMERLGNTLEVVLPSAGRATGEALGAIFDALDQPSVQKAAIGLFENVEKAISALAPAMPEVAEGLAAITDVIGLVGTNIADALAPALEALGPAIEQLRTDFEPLIETLGNILVGAVEGAAAVLPTLVAGLGGLADALNTLLAPIELLVDAFGMLPGPVQSALGVLTGIGLLVGGGMWFGSLVTAKLSAFGKALTVASQEARIASGAIGTAGIAAQRGSANFARMRGGLLVAGAALSGIVSSATPAESAISNISTVASGVFGGAAMGAAGGPWGALIGGVIGGAISGLQLAIGGASDSMRDALPAAEAYAASLDQITGAATESTRALLNESLKKGDSKKILDEYGISARTAINAILGQAGARKQLSAVIDQELQQGQAWLAQAERMRSEDTSTFDSEQMNEWQRRIDLYQEDGEAAIANAEKLQALIDQHRKLAEQTREDALAVADLSKIYKGVPPKVLTKIDAIGGIDALQDVKNLTKQYRLTPKQVRTLITASNLDITDKRVKNLIQRLREAGRLKVAPKVEAPNTKPAEQAINNVRRGAEGVKNTDGKMPKFTQGVQVSIRAAERDAKQGGKNVRDGAEKPVKQTKADLRALQQSVRSGTQAAASIARTGGTSIGTNLKNGIIAGFAGTASILATQASNAVTSAIAAANRAGQIESPSRKMMEVGKYLGEGLVVGLNRQQKNAAKAGKGLAEAVFVKQFGKELDKLKEKVDSTFDSLLDAKKTKEQRAHFRAMFDDVSDRFGKLTNKAERWMRQLEKAREKVKQLKADMKAFEEQTAQTVIETGNPTAIEFPSLNNIIAKMKEARDNAIKFQAVIKALIKNGLNQTTLKQILAAGPEAGLATAESILNGGISQVNALQAQIEKAAGGVADAAGDHLFGGLVDEAQSDVDKLIGKLKPLQARLRQFAKELVKAFRQGVEAEFARNDPKKGGSDQAHNKSVKTATKEAVRRVAHQATAQAAAAVVAQSVAPTLAVVESVAEEAGKAFGENFAEALETYVSRGRELYEQLLNQLATEGQRAQMRAQFEGQFAAIEGMTKEYERLNGLLTTAQSKVSDLRSEMESFQGSLRDSITSLGDPTKVEFATYENIVASMEDAREKAQAFGQVIQKLIGQGLNQTTLKQILAAGPEAGLATAEAILDGGVSQINAIQAQIEKAAGGVARASGEHLFGGLIDEAEHQVDGILAQLQPLQKKLEEFAIALVDALKAELARQFASIQPGAVPTPTPTTSAPPRPSRAAAPSRPQDRPGAPLGSGWRSYVGQQINYYAPQQSRSLTAEEHLFAAARRGRMRAA